MSDSSEDEDLSRFKEAIDSSFVKLIDESRGNPIVPEKPLNSERYLDVASHYNDIKVPDVMQKQIGAKISAIITKNFEFVDANVSHKKRKIKGGVKLFSSSEGFLTCDAVLDEVTITHNKEAKKFKESAKKRCVGDLENCEDEMDKIRSVAVSGQYVLSKDETKCWNTRRKEKLFKYKSRRKSKILTAVD